MHVLAVEADEWFHQVIHKISGSFELGRQFFVSLSWAHFMLIAWSVP